jgi:hypothetical protein
MEVLYKGEKYFDQYRKKIEILLVNHEDFSCIEIIVLGIRLLNRPARLYLNSSNLISKMNGVDFETSITEKRRVAQKLKLPFIYGFEMKKTALNMITTMLVDGLNIAPSIFISEFDLCFELDGQSYLEEDNDFEYAVKPRELIPFKFVHSLPEQLR